MAPYTRNIELKEQFKSDSESDSDNSLEFQSGNF